VADQRLAHAGAPRVRIDVEREQLVAERGREPGDRAIAHADHGARAIGATERVARGAILGAQARQVVGRHQTGITDLPRAHVDARDRHRIVGDRGPDFDHVIIVACHTRIAARARRGVQRVVCNGRALPTTFARRVGGRVAFRATSARARRHVACLYATP
jgi:hypothetical protein